MTWCTHVSFGSRGRAGSQRAGPGDSGNRASGEPLFGTADELTKLIDSAPSPSRYLVIDLKRVTEIDSTGVLMLRRIDNKLQSEGRTLLLSYLVEGTEKRKALGNMGLTRPEKESRIFEGTDAALAYSEERLLSGGFCKTMWMAMWYDIAIRVFGR